MSPSPRRAADVFEVAAIVQSPAPARLGFHPADAPDKPIGTYLLLWPTLWALWIAAEGVPSAKNLFIFITG